MLVAYFADQTKRKNAIHETHDEVVSEDEMHETIVDVASVNESESNED